MHKNDRNEANSFLTQVIIEAAESAIYEMSDIAFVI